jgi:hypothetical protein
MSRRQEYDEFAELDARILSLRADAIAAIADQIDITDRLERMLRGAENSAAPEAEPQQLPRGKRAEENKQS